MIMPFGKYKNQDIELIPSDYLRWIIDNIQPDSDKEDNLINACEKELDFRDKYRDHF